MGAIAVHTVGSETERDLFEMDFAVRVRILDLVTGEPVRHPLRRKTSY